MQNIKEIICSCGGKFEETLTTADEREEHGCFRDSENHSCCVGAVKCTGCGVRITVTFSPPEVIW